MGREARRVPLDFDWPLKQTWGGYLMPDRLVEPKCRDCDGEGYSPEARAIAGTFYAHMIPGDRASQDALCWSDKIGQREVDNLIARGRLRTWRDGEWHSDPRTADEVNASQRGGGLDGHDAINRSFLIEYRCELLGIEMRCPSCAGEGYIEAYPGQRAESEAWESTDPPTGEGWQMWETTSEGSPISPVFATAEELAGWCAGGATVFGHSTATAREWLSIITGDEIAHVQIAPGVVIM
jgi:hypothetical protein